MDHSRIKAVRMLNHDFPEWDQLISIFLGLRHSHYSVKVTPSTTLECEVFEAHRTVMELFSGFSVSHSNLRSSTFFLTLVLLLF